MEKNRSIRNNMRSREQIERDRAIREKYQSAKPSLADVKASPEYLPAITQAEYFEMVDFAMRIKARRELMKLSLAEVASIAGIDKSAISRLENGQVDNPTYSTLERIAKALNQRLRLVLEDEPVPA